MPEQILACHDCDLLHRLPSAPAVGTARCLRCGAVLYQERAHTIEKTLALTLAAAFLFGIVNALPFLSFEMQGQVTQTTLASGVEKLWEQDRFALSLLVLLTAIVAPALQLGLHLYVLVPLHFRRRPWLLSAVFRTVRRVRPWSMMEVFLIGILVALVKLADLAEIIPGIGVWAFGLLIMVLAAATASLDDSAVWRHIGTRS